MPTSTTTDALLEKISQLEEKVDALSSQLHKTLWDHTATFSHDIDIHACVLGSRASAEYVIQHMPKARVFKGPGFNAFGSDTEGADKLLEYKCQIAPEEGLVLEFGVFSGRSINYISELFPGKTIHGFDSFYGLPEDWKKDGYKGTFSRNGEAPSVVDAVELHAGWFDECLPKFVQGLKSDEKVSFIHIDCDIYSSTITVLNSLQPYLQEGTVIVFDEYFNYPGWQEHEHKAWREFTTANNIQYDYFGYASKHYSVGAQIKSIPNS